MSAEFTGERVVPGQVDVDLWNEHAARYAFAARLARHRRVLDAGCGTGYGSAELAGVATRVAGVDVSPDAIDYARREYARPNVRWMQASATALPFASASFDLVAAFEVIEHLDDWPELLREARRVLAPGGQFLVSTPNKTFYADARAESGPNPFHTHEFEYDEFHDALAAVFPSVAMFLQDHAEGILFHAAQANRGPADVRIEPGTHDPRTSNFFLAVCAMTPQIGAPTFVYMPRAANVLRERALHIARLKSELAAKDEWLAAARAEHKTLVDLHTCQTDELRRSNEWARRVDLELQAAAGRVLALQSELEQEQRQALATASAYEQRLAELDAELVRRTEWARDLEASLAEQGTSLQHQTAELAKAVELLNAAEATVEERTRWALALEQERKAMEAAVRASRWVKLGRALGVGPELRKA